MPRAEFTEAARSTNVQGNVRLKVVLLATGQIGAITPITKLPYGLTEQAIAAARQITFKPKMVNGVAMSVVVTVDYLFSLDAKEPRVVEDDGASLTEVTPEMLREQKLKEKLHAWVYALIDRLRLSKNDLTPNEAKFVRDGKAEIVVVLNAKSADTIEKLKALGLEVGSTKDGISVTGRIAVEKLTALAELDGVKWILPRTL
jgi:TonB family protein